MKELLSKYFIQWSFSAFTMIVAIMTFFLYLRVDSKYERELREIRADDKYIQEQISDSKIMTSNERYLKYTDFYARIIGWYSEKPQSGRSMNRYQRADFVINAYNYESWLGLPYFYFVSIAKFESYFNPKAVGLLDERGLFQHMPIDSVIGTAYANLRELYIVSPWLAKKLEFYYKKPEDLFDPLNALKIEALLAWGYKRKYAHQEIWWVSARHWGDGKIYHLYKKNLIPPEKFTFNKGTLKENARNPLMYYYIYSEHHTAFSSFRKDVNIDKSYIERYKKYCSMDERKYIERWEYIKELDETNEELKKTIEEVQIKQRKYDQLIENALLEYKKLNKLIKTGKYKTIKEIYLIAKHIFVEFIKQIVNEEMKLKLKLIGAIIAIYSLINQVLFFIGLVHIVKAIKKHRRKQTV